MGLSGETVPDRRGGATFKDGLREKVASMDWRSCGSADQEQRRRWASARVIVQLRTFSENNNVSAF